jgi:thymidine kinase
MNEDFVNVYIEMMNKKIEELTRSEIILQTRLAIAEKVLASFKEENDSLKEEIEKMLPWATKVEKLSAVCVVCNRDAYYTYKKQTGGNEIEVGGSELYEPRCCKCHPLILNRESLFFIA